MSKIPTLDITRYDSDRDAFVAAVSDLFDLSAQPQADGGVRLTARSVGG